MFRLKQLDDTPENIMNGTNRPVDPHSLTSAMPFLHRRPATYIQAQSTRFTHMVASACVFHIPNNPSSTSADPEHQKPRLLLVQRAAHDTFPLHQEIPGGMVDATDATISAAVARELVEETGMVMKKVLAQVEPPETFTTGWGRRLKKWVRLVWIVEADGAASEEVSEVDNEGNVKTFISDVATASASTSDADVDAVGDATKHVSAQHHSSVAEEVETDDLDEEVKVERALEVAKAQAEAKWLKERKAFEATLGVPAVKLDRNEHISHFWATEEEVREKRAKSGGGEEEDGEGRDGQWRELLFVRDEQVDTLIRAFALLRKKMSNGWSSGSMRERD